MGYAVSTETTGDEAAVATERLKPDVVLMDIRLGGSIDGIQAAEQIRRATDIPIIFLTSYTDHQTIERAAASEPAGYIVKPFDERQLATTLQLTILARRNRLAALECDPRSVIRIGDLEIDPSKHRAFQRGAEILLTPKEFDILQCLAERPGELVSPEAMLSRIWGPQFIHYTQTLRVHIGHLRQKLENDSPSSIRIEVVRAVGYRLAEAGLERADQSRRLG